MIKAVGKVVKSIEVGKYFDVHFVANKLFQEHTRDYYRLIREHPNTIQAVLVRKIGRTIMDHFPDCEYIGQSVSYNIHGNYNDVRMFKRVGKK